MVLETSIHAGTRVNLAKDGQLTLIVVPNTIYPRFSTHEANIGFFAYLSLGNLDYSLSRIDNGNYCLTIDTNVRFGKDRADFQIPILIENLEQKGYSIVKEVQR